MKSNHANQEALKPQLGMLGMSPRDSLHSESVFKLPDGKELDLVVEPGGAHVFALGGLAARYTQEQVETIGEGSIAIGVANVLGQIIRDPEIFYSEATYIPGTAREIQSSEQTASRDLSPRPGLTELLDQINKIR